jgi:EAL domain-containing protein (putative c-di-GMP-specific phosphodiesterase class I)
MVNDSDMAIMQAMITVGHSLGLSVVVEGVETTEQDKLVRDLGCDLAQGFLYARPMPADQMPI